MLVGQDAHNAISCADSLHAVSLFNFAGISFAIDVEIVDTTTKATRRNTEYACRGEQIEEKEKTNKKVRRL